MNTSETVLLVFVLALILYKIVLLWIDHKPHIVTIVLPEDHQKVFIEYYVYYSWYDCDGNLMWTKKAKRKYLFTT